MVTPLVMDVNGEHAVTDLAGTWTLGEGCTDQTSCISQTVRRGGLCGAPESLEVAVNNHCSAAVALGVCVERIDGGWECTVHKRLASGRGQKSVVSTCHATGKVSLRATWTADLTKNANCLRGPRGPLAPTAPTPGAAAKGDGCTAAQACCQALVNVRGMESLSTACGQLAQLNDASNAAACAQVLAFLRQAVTELPSVPLACQ